jgi:uncharacterized protein (TIGR03086 family)
MYEREGGCMTTTEQSTSRPITPAADDPRPAYRAALRWVTDLVDGVRPDQFGSPTPCPEFDVRTLLGHLVATTERARVIGAGGSPFDVPVVVPGIADGDGRDVFAASAARVWEVWDDDTRLTASVTVPWGTVPGAEALWGYLNEALVHGFDLAAATGQPTEADPAAVQPLLDRIAAILPGGFRGGPVPFEAVVEPAADAGPTERLANWSGRTTR